MPEAGTLTAITSLVLDDSLPLLQFGDPSSHQRSNLVLEIGISVRSK